MPRRVLRYAWLLVVCLALMIGLMAGPANAKITLRMQSHLPPEQAKRTIGKVIEQINKMTNGEITIALHPADSLVPTKQLLEAVGNGTLDMATVSEGYHHKLIPVSELGQGLPFAFKDNSEAFFFMYQRGYLQLLRKGYEKFNVHVIPWEPFNVGLMTKEPIRGVDDLKGMKLRAYGTMQKWLSKLGAATTYVPGGELYTALSTGVVDGAHWGDAFPMFELKLHEVLKNYMEPEPIMGSWNTMWVNGDVWKKLTPTQQAIIEAAALAGGDAESFNDTRVRTKFALQEMQSKWGVAVNQVPPAELAKMQKAAHEVWADMAKNNDPLLQEAFKLLYAYMAELGRPVK
ncbi:MAG: TRAP transporter substrate-binding protein DctP [Pseudomonadota bacterium]